MMHPNILKECRIFELKLGKEYYDIYVTNRWAA